MNDGSKALKLSQHWFNLGVNFGADDSTEKFIHFYIAFDILSTALSGKNTPSQCLNWVKTGDNEFKRAFLWKYEHNPKALTGALEGLRRLGPIQDRRPKGGSHELTSTSKDSFDQMVEVMYQIRCNLFHSGQVDPNPGRENNILLYANRVMKLWLEFLALERHTNA